MPQVSLNFSAISAAIAKPGPRPSTKAEFARTSRFDSARQSQASAASNCSGSAATAARRPASSRHSATSASAASTETTKVLVAATLFSGPARSGSPKSAASAIGAPATLVIATVSAPPSRALAIISTMSGLWPDCEMPRQAAPSSRSRRP